MQRAGGQFAAADGSDAGEFIKRIWLLTGAPPPADQGIVLRLNGGTVAGREWSRDKGPALLPKTWEVVVDLTQLPSSSGLIGLPILVVETQSGRQEWTVPVWWTYNTAVGEVSVQVCYACCPSPRRVLLESETSTSNRVKVSFGTEFIPVEGIGGFEVGTYVYNWGWPRHYDENGILIFDDCSSEGSINEQYVAIFWDRFYNTPSNSATVSQGLSTRRRVDESDRNAYTRPPGPPPEPPPLVQKLRFRRQYSPYEMQSYLLLGITPPEYEIELR